MMVLKPNGLLWWAYIHENGTLQVKRYFDKMDLVEADESPFVRVRTEAFEADSREDAWWEARRLLSAYITN